MGICRDSRHKRRETGGRRKIHIKKRKFELGRPGANTKLTPGDKRVRVVRARVVRAVRVHHSLRPC